MAGQIYEYDPAQALDRQEAIAVFLLDALETGDAAYIAKAMDVAARSKGALELTKKNGTGIAKHPEPSQVLANQ